jgi:ABC-type glycerol-3-phosphate transport system substrate-binding protein
MSIVQNLACGRRHIALSSEQIYKGLRTPYRSVTQAQEHSAPNTSHATEEGGKAVNLKRCAKIVPLLVVSSLLIVSLASSAMAKTVVEWWTLASFFVTEAEQAWITQWEAEFEKNNPDIDLEIRAMPGGTAGLNEAIALGIATGTAPDIAYMPINTVGRWTHGGILGGFAEPLNRYLETWPYRQQMLASLLDAATIDGNVIALPYMMWPNCEVYNLNITETSGVALPNNWDEQLAAMRKLTRVDGAGVIEQYGYQGPVSASYFFYLLGRVMEQQGVKLIEPGATQGFINNDAGRQAMYYIAELYRTGMPDKYGMRWPAINSNKVASFFGDGQSANVHNLTETGVRPAFRGFVGPQGGTDVIWFNGGAHYILSTSKNKDAAWRVLADFTTPSNLLNYYVNQPRQQPVFTSLINHRSIVSRPYSSELLQLFTLPIVSYGPVHALLTEIATPVGEILKPAGLGDAPIESALIEGERLMNQILADNMIRQ